MTGETHRHGRVVVGMELEAGDAADELWCRPWCHGSSFRLGFLFLCFFSGWCRMIQFLFEILSLMLLQCHSLMVRATFFLSVGLDAGSDHLSMSSISSCQVAHTRCCYYGEWNSVQAQRQRGQHELNREALCSVLLNILQAQIDPGLCPCDTGHGWT